MTAIGPRIRRLRERRGWSQTDLANALGWSRQRVNNLETGDVAEPKLATLRSLAEALDVSLAELLDE